MSSENLPFLKFHPVLILFQSRLLTVKVRSKFAFGQKLENLFLMIRKNVQEEKHSSTDINQWGNFHFRTPFKKWDSQPNALHNNCYLMSSILHFTKLISKWVGPISQVSSLEKLSLKKKHYLSFLNSGIWKALALL